VKIVIAEPGRTFEVVQHEMTPREQRRTLRALARQGIQVEPAIDAFHVLHLWAKAPLSTIEEVWAIAAFAAVTDARIAFHPAQAVRRG
jgi:hypothetical protein